MAHRHAAQHDTDQHDAPAHSPEVNPTIAPARCYVGTLDGKLYNRTDALPALAKSTSDLMANGHADVARLLTIYTVRLARVIEQTEDADAIARMDDEGAAR